MATLPAPRLGGRPRVMPLPDTLPAPYRPTPARHPAGPLPSDTRPTLDTGACAKRLGVAVSVVYPMTFQLLRRGLSDCFPCRFGFCAGLSVATASLAVNSMNVKQWRHAPW